MGNGEKEINNVSLKNCEVVVNCPSEVSSQKKPNVDPIKQYRRRRVGSLNQYTRHLQNPSGKIYRVGKLRKIFAPLKLGLVPLKDY